MGFLVEISCKTPDLIERLCRNPTAVFDKPFAGVLVFLFSQVDEDVWEWFGRHLDSLNALTGEDVAFAVFARRWTVSFKVSGQRPCRRPRWLGVIDDVEDGFNVERLVKSGSLGWVVDGDTVSAINQAAYEIARELRVTERLPCVIALDGIPDPRVPFVCIPVPQQNLTRADLFKAIRRAVGRLQSSPGFGTYKRALLEQWNASIELEEARRAETECRRRMELARGRFVLQQVLNEFDRPPQKKEELRHEILLGRLRAHDPQADVRLPFVGHLARQVEALRLHRTIERLLDGLSRGGTLRPSRVAKLPPAIRTPLERLASDELGGGAVILAELHAKLRQDLETAARCVAETFPNAEEWERWDAEVMAEKLEPLGGMLKKAEQAVARHEAQLVRATRATMELPGRPSFTRLLSDEAGIPAEEVDANPGGWMDWAPLGELLGVAGRHTRFRFVRWLEELSRRIGAVMNERPPSAFASYAHQDRDEVLRRVQGMRAFQPRLDVFLDFHSLHSGERWRERLEREIADRDRFFLFWSEGASRSESVRDEWMIAMRLSKPITPVPLVPPSLAPPPAELAHLHFDDRYVEYLRCARTIEA